MQTEKFGSLKTRKGSSSTAKIGQQICLVQDKNRTDEY